MHEQLQYMYGLSRFGIKPGLERMEQMMELLGHPEQKFKSIHVAGTNGKGSTAAMLDCVLRQGTLKVGLYTSPHMYVFNERIRVQGESISDAELAALAEELRALIEKHEIPATFFEFTTALAYMYFVRQGVDIAVVEVGMGGLLDATNVITPLVSVITNVGLDHTEFLGDTKEKIAFEKAGVIKSGVPVVTSERQKSVLSVIRAAALTHRATLHQAHQDSSVEKLSSSWDGQRVEVRGVWQGQLHLPLLGDHQLENLAAALTALHALRRQDIDISWEQIERGIESTRWAGRLDVLSREPLIVLDGAHNNDGAEALYQFIRHWPRHDVLVVGEKYGKEIPVLAQRIVPLFDRVIVSQGSFQPQDPQELAEQLGPYSRHIEVIVSLPRALTAARASLPPKGTLLITGSLYMVGDALTVLDPAGRQAGPVQPKRAGRVEPAAQG